MATPKALRDKRAALEKRLGLGDLVEDVDASTVTPAGNEPMDETQFQVNDDNTPTPAPTPSPAPAKAAPPEDTAEQRWKTAQGIIRAERKRNEEMAARIAALEAQVAKKPEPTETAAKPKLTFDDGDSALTTEEATQYAKSIPIVRKIVAGMLEKALSPILDKLADKSEALVQDVKSVRQSVENTRAQTFNQALLARIPDINQLARDDDFKDYISQPIPGPYGQGRSIRDALTDAYENDDVETISDIVAEYRESQGEPPAPVRLGSLEQPKSSGAQRGQLTPPSQTPKKLAWSKREEASSLFRRGQMPREQFNKIRSVYDKALTEGRVDMDA